MCVGNEEGDIISLESNKYVNVIPVSRIETCLYWFPPQYDETFRSLHHESSKFVTQNTLYFVRLLDLNTESNGID